MSVPAAQQPIFVGDNRLDVSAWEGNWKILDANVSTSATRDTRYAQVRGDHEATIRMPVDADNAPEVAGLVLGQIVPALYFQHGSTLYDLLEYCLVTSAPKTSDNTSDVPRIVVTVKGGDLTQNVFFD